MAGSSGWGGGAAAAVEALLKLAGGEAILRMRSTCGDDAPPEEVSMRPCMLRIKGDAAELLVSAGAMRRAFGPGQEGAGWFETLPMTARVVARETVWRVAASTAVECGGAAVAWRLQLVR